MTDWSLKYEDRCKRAHAAVAGDVWRSPKNGKTVVVLGRIGYYGVHLQHESGKRTCKLEHYLASDYEPVQQGPTSERTP